MGKNSRIEWTDHTFNPWWGCTKVSGLQALLRGGMVEARRPARLGAEG